MPGDERQHRIRCALGGGTSQFRGDWIAHGQSQGTAGEGFFSPEAYSVADVLGWIALGREVTLRGGVLNLTDQNYFEWPNVRGRPAADPTIDRYSSPGISGLVSVSYGW